MPFSRKDNTKLDKKHKVLCRIYSKLKIHISIDWPHENIFHIEDMSQKENELFRVGDIAYIEEESIG